MFKSLNSRKYIAPLLSVSIVMLIAGCTSCSSGGQRLKKPDPTTIAQGEGLRLSQVLAKNIKQEPLTEERQKLLKDIAFAISHRKNKNILTAEQCLKKYFNAEECRFLKTTWSQDWVEEYALQGNESEEVLVKISRSKRQKNIDKIVKNIKAKKVEVLPNQRPGDFYLALKKFKSWDADLAAFSQFLLDNTACYSAETYSYLGLKAEEYFPNQELLQLAKKIYKKGDDCGASDSTSKTVSKYVQTARFRYGLLSVLDHDCKTATEVFSRLAKTNASDYTTRALYWSGHCAKSDSNEENFLTYYEHLFRTNPLGFHTLSINKGSSVLVDNLGKPIDPIVQSRTETQPQFNVWIHALEDLDYMAQYDAVRRMFAPIRHSAEFLSNFEPGVRLYLSTFAYRANDRMSLFRILDSVFRTQSEYVVDSTMKLFYPMEHFDSIMSNTKKVNPFLIAALIRQESAFQAEARSHVGAVGLMQLMPATARLMDRKVKKNQLFNADTNVRLGVKYFENLVDHFNGDVELALAAYNAGPEAVENWMKRYPLQNKMLFLDLIPFSETRNYVTLIGRNYYWYTHLYADIAMTEMGESVDVAQKRQPAVFNALKPKEE